MSNKEKFAGFDFSENHYKEEARNRWGDKAVDKSQATIQEWYFFLNKTGHHYSLTAFKSLGEMYVNDERFMKNIDQFGDGLAKFMCDAMSIYAKNNEEK